VGAPSFALFAKGGMHNCSLTALAFVGQVRNALKNLSSAEPVENIATHTKQSKNKFPKTSD